MDSDLKLQKKNFHVTTPNKCGYNRLKGVKNDILG